MEITIFSISFIIFAIGAWRFIAYGTIDSLVKALCIFVAISVALNVVDVFVQGNLTVIRQSTFLIQSIIFTAYSLRR